MPKAEHSAAYRLIPHLLREMREDAAMTQRELGKKLGKPQSWVYNCETANRRVDVAEFATWCRACRTDPRIAFDEIVGTLR